MIAQPILRRRIAIERSKVMDIRNSQRIKEIRDNTAKMADAFTRIADALERLVKTEPQKKEVEWIYNKREKLWDPYLDGELLFKTENSEEKPNSLE